MTHHAMSIAAPQPLSPSSEMRFALIATQCGESAALAAATSIVVDDPDNQHGGVVRIRVVAGFDGFGSGVERGAELDAPGVGLGGDGRIGQSWDIDGACRGWGRSARRRGDRAESGQTGKWIDDAGVIGSHKSMAVCRQERAVSAPPSRLVSPSLDRPRSAAVSGQPSARVLGPAAQVKPISCHGAP